MRAKKYIKYFSRTTRTKSWKSNRMSNKNVENNITKSGHNLASILLILVYYQI